MLLLRIAALLPNALYTVYVSLLRQSVRLMPVLSCHFGIGDRSEIPVALRPSRESYQIPRLHASFLSCARNEVFHAFYPVILQLLFRDKAIRDVRFPQPLQRAILIKRYKRFLADVRLDCGEILTIHCPNTGSMKNCLAEGASLWYSVSHSGKRKYPATWEIATTPAGHLAGINTGRANGLVREALVGGLIPQLGGYTELTGEVRYGNERSRIDYLLQIDGRAVYVEVKNVTLCEENGEGYFPDAISERGGRHLRELAQMTQQGHRAALVYCVQHSGIAQVAPARHIDSAYAAAYDAAVAAGVEVYAVGARMSPEEILLDRLLPVIG